jgi:hypothetical protein
MGSGVARQSPRSGFGEPVICSSSRIGSSDTVKNGRMSNSQLRSSGCHADSAALAHISSARVLSMGSHVVAGWQSSTERELTSCAAIVIGSPMPAQREDRYDRHCVEQIIFVCDLAESRARHRCFPIARRACTTRITSAFNLLY